MAKEGFRIKPIHVFVLALMVLMGHFAGVYKIPLIPSLSAIQEGVQEDNTVSVTRLIKFAVMDKYAGSGVASAVIAIYDGTSPMESLTTDSDGTKTTALTYTSGKQLNIYVSKSNSKCWYKFTVPKMLKDDVIAITTNKAELDFFTIDTAVALKVVDNAGNTLSANGDDINFTKLGVTTATLNIMGYVSADAKGYIASDDPVNNIAWDVVCYGTVSGTNYEYTSMSGWELSGERGTTFWYAATIPETGVCKQKVGTTYVYPGVFSKTVQLSKGSYTGTSGSHAHFTVYLYAYSDPAYYKDQGSYGPDSVAMASSLQLDLITGA